MPLSRRVGAEFIGLFWLAPIVGVILAGLVYPWLAGKAKKTA